MVVPISAASIGLPRASVKDISLIYQYVMEYGVQYLRAPEHRAVIGFFKVSPMHRKAPKPSNTLPHLGELELTLLKALWEAPDQSAHNLHQQLPPAYAGSLSTVQSTLERLHRKSLVQRDKRGHAYVYRARLGRAELLGKLLGGVIRQLHNGSLEPILSSFVDFADRFDDDTLDKLDALVQQRLERREGDH